MRTIEVLRVGVCSALCLGSSTALDAQEAQEAQEVATQEEGVSDDADAQEEDTLDLDEQSFDVAVLLHAQALEAELDGEIDKALALLRKALARSPQDVEIAADLARVAYESGRPSLRNDAKVFLDMAPSNPREYLLQTYIHIELGDNEMAKQTIGRGVRAHPTDGETVLLSQRLGVKSMPQPGAQKPLLIRFKLAGIYDSNVKVLPEELFESQQGDGFEVQGTRTQAEGLVMWNGELGKNRGTVGAFMSGGVHPTEAQEDLQEFNQGIVSVFGVYSLQGKRSTTNIGLDGALVTFKPSLNQTFMTSEGLSVGWAQNPPKQGGAWGIGAKVSYRDFDVSNQEDPSEQNSRDGMAFQMGPSYRFRTGPWALSGRLQGNFERADGAKQQVRGGRLQLGALRRFGKVDANFGLAYDHREFFRAAANGRLDQRVTPSAQFRWQAKGPLAVVASYAYTQNFSQPVSDRLGLSEDELDYSYVRHMPQLGLEATW